MADTLPQKTRTLLMDSLELITHSQSIVGFDGFVDTILHVVDKRQSAAEYTRMTAMSSFGERIKSAAGLSMNFEYVTKMVKLGGNGPIMANALHRYGTPLTYIGNLGAPALNPIFEDLASRARVISIAEPGYTDAIEFEDGKLMCGKHESLKRVCWDNILAHIPADELLNLFESAAIISLVNWTMLPRMNEIFEHLLDEIAPKLQGDKRWLFFDLADPAKRTSEDIAEVLNIIAKFQPHFNVVLGLNLNESHQIGEVLNISVPADDQQSVANHAAAIRAALAIDTVVIHPTAFAAAANAHGCTAVGGPYCEKPKITTGAGDHFNAGFCIGRLIGADLAVSLQIGVATSGYYVRNAESPGIDAICDYLKTL